ncbi:MAG: 2-C-methyl-D-erythritol 4-phosphate cytidylyltransferase [Oscillospiraceae bacterium]|nr:2-C-methyl-D-erythritol 4-phosphate cytidylyltransferase [Oscillospiraceae bacterium]
MPLFKLLKLLMPISLKKTPTCSVVIAAAGSSQRCKGEDKLFYEINAKPVLAYTIEAFQKCDSVNEIVVVTKENNLGKAADMCRRYGLTKVSKVITGGMTRTQSVYNGVCALSDKAKLIAIHDGARPCISGDIIVNTINKAAKFNAAVACVKVTSTLKIADGSMIIKKTVDRDGFVEVQTPQIFRAQIIKAALANVIKKSIACTDDCGAVELLAVPIHITEGSGKNIKITTPEDLEIAEAFLS